MRVSLEIEFTRAGIHLPQLGLWLDARKRQRASERVFVRLPGKRREHILTFGERREFQFERETFHLTAIPAGHILGSAMAFIEWRDETLLYTGDFKLRASLAAEPPETRPADLLIMETTFGLPRYQFPPEQTVRDDIAKFCRDTLADGATPVLYGYSLGKSQEILLGLAGANLPIQLHRDVRKMTKLYEKLGMNFPAHEAFDPETARGKIIIAPPNSLKTMQKVALGKIRTAAITGWAMDSSCRYRSGTDAAFSLSDHADYDGLLELVKRVQPKKVFTVHGFTREFAQTLRAQGVDSVAPGWHEQMALL